MSTQAIVIAAIVFVCYWAYGMVIFAVPLGIQMLRHAKAINFQTTVLDYIWTWVVMLTVMPLAWPLFLLDLYNEVRKREREKRD